MGERVCDGGGGVVALTGDEGGVVALRGGLLLVDPVEAEEEEGALSCSCCCAASVRVVLFGSRFQNLGTWGLFWSQRAWTSLSSRLASSPPGDGDLQPLSQRMEW